jgi:hypothetical protein
MTTAPRSFRPARTSVPERPTHDLGFGFAGDDPCCPTVADIIKIEACQFRARSIGHRLELPGNSGDRSGPTQVNERPGEGAEMRLYSGPGRPRVRPDHLIADKTSHAVSLSSCCQGLGREPRGFLVGLSGLQPGRQSAALASATSFAATCRSLCSE